MDQLTIACVPEVYPSVNQTEQLAAVISEVAAEAFRLNSIGCQVELEFRGSGVRITIFTPFKMNPLPRNRFGDNFLTSAPFKRFSDSVHSFSYFEQRVFSDDSFDVAVDKAEQWLSQLSIVERNLAAFQCCEPSPLRVVN